MPRLARKHLPQLGIYHVTGRSVHGQALFVHDLDRLDFLALFDKASRQAAWKCHAWCLMNTHYHAVLETSIDALSGAMHRLHTTYAQRFNRRHERRGHLFEGRFSSWVIRDEEHLEATRRYVLGNPLQAGMDPSWPWTGPQDAHASSRRTSSSSISEKSSYESPTA